MDVQLLEDIGLTKVQATAYKALVDHGAQTAPALAARLGESRTNGYKVLDKLVELGLAIKEPRGGKYTYAATSPASLEQFVRQQAEVIRQKERRLNTELPHLLDYYFAHSERPSVRYFEGQEGLLRMYRDQMATGQPVKFIRGKYDYQFLGFEEMHKMRNMFPRLGIQRECIIQDKLPIELPEANRMPVEESDKTMLLRRTWISEDDYTAPVEWTVYGDKLSIIQYGEQAMGMLIESKPIASAFRQLYRLLDEGIRRRPDYAYYPKIATYTAIPESIKGTNKTNSAHQ
jgi:predicted transcriptional regulator